MWNYLLKVIIDPLVKHFYIGYNYKSTNIVFVVKYSMNGQKELMPHHDSSSYTVNICLNDTYEGGEVHFIKQNYMLKKRKLGSIVIHPGRCTHYHCALPITSGNKYILVGFID